MKDNLLRNTILIAGLVLIGVIGRVLPHPPNFTPTLAIGLLAGMMFRRNGVSLFIVMAAMGISDWFLGGYNPRVMVAVYASLLISVSLGHFLNSSPLRIIGIPVLGSLIFFLLTNGAVWYFSTYYPKDWGGLMFCYKIAIPFAIRTLAANVMYTSLMVLAYQYGPSFLNYSDRKRVTHESALI